MSSSQEAELNRLFGRWSELMAAGQVVSLEELCDEEGYGDQPELAAQLAQRIELAQSVSQFAAGRSTSQPDIASMAVEPDAESPAEATRACDQSTTWREPTTGVSAGERASSTSSQSDMVSFSRFDSPQFIARGGLGEVFSALEVAFGRDVAIKFIRSDRARKKSYAQVFKTEAEITARLEHPGVVPIYAMGADSQGRPFYVMRLIHGETLDDRIGEFHKTALGSDLERGEHAVKFRKLLSQFVSVCNTIAYAHQRGILHRDIKPQNIMLGKYGETLVVDWGLARATERDDEDRCSGEETLMPGASDNDPEFAQGVVGTPSYMSPEQADGNLPVGKPTDVYSLGATLYKILTGEMAIQSDSIGSTLARVRRGDFRSPRQCKSNVPAPLNAICCKAMEGDPLRRYGTSLDLAADIERYLADEPVTAMRESWKGRTGRWLRHHSAATKAIAATALATLMAAVVVFMAIRQQRERLIVEQLQRLEVKAITEEQMLKDDIQNLRHSVRFLASQPATLASLGDADAATAAKDQAVDLFRDFIADRSGYMQARLIGGDGQELVRVERTEPGGPIERTAEQQLQNKGGKLYFTETLRLAPGQVFLSELNLNQEGGVKDWEFPVVRAAVPVFAPSEENETTPTALGVAIINMHFESLAKQVENEDASGNDLLIYLTNDRGQFLLHPTEGVKFRFEEGLDYPIEEVYPKLAPFLASRDRNQPSFSLRHTLPNPGILVEYSGEQRSASHPLTQLVAEVMQEFRHVKPEYNGDRTRAVLTGMGADQMEEVMALIRRVGTGVSIRPLPRHSGLSEQAVYCRKIFFDEQQPDRFLNLVLALPYE